MRSALPSILLLAFPAAVLCLCPFMGRPAAPVQEATYPRPQPGFAEAVQKTNWTAVKEDIKLMFKDSKSFWPADYGNYAPFFVRLAWHNSGSYRTSDGRGGVDGGRQRFEPERSWDDNTNLDKARRLLWPIKEKYGLGLSWGDLIILTGNTAVESMGGPILGFCAGRIDDSTGEWSEELGPTTEQRVLAPCEVNGECERPLGSTTIGLIYLNPEGPMGQPLPEQSALEVRDTFGRMAMNDTETLALIGGGHAFGKTHGACPAGAGPPPIQDPMNPWPGACGTGKGVDAFTSGFDGPWTVNPTQWDNSYFHNLVDYTWEKFTGPGGKWMWRVNGTTSPQAPAADGNGKQNIMMMTSDISLISDPTGSYQKIVSQYAAKPTVFDHNWMHAWYKLTTRDMGPITRCVGPDVPPPQDWQKTLPAAPAKLADFTKVKAAVSTLLKGHGSFDITSRMTRLAYSCASTFRVSDYLGGCNGASIRLSPIKDFPEFSQLDSALDLLKPVKAKFGDRLSWADLIVLAGSAAVEHAGGVTLPAFCGGRTDATEAVASDSYLRPRISGGINDTLAVFRDYFKVMGLTPRQAVALAALPVDQDFRVQQGYEAAAWAKNPTVLSTDYFKVLLDEDFVGYTVEASGKQQYKAVGKEIYMLKTDMFIKSDPELASIAQEFASEPDVFKAEFSAVWNKLMIADRFDGPTGNVCEKTTALSQADLVVPL